MVRDEDDNMRKGFREFKKKLTDAVADSATTNQIIYTARTDPRMQARWMEYCGVDKVEDIDYNQPEVYIEFMACDPAIYALADNPDKFIEETRCDRATFMKYYDVTLPDSRFDDAKARKKAMKQAFLHKMNPRKSKKN